MSRYPRRAARLAVAAVAPLTVLAPARAANISWSSPTSGRWLDPANWSTAAVPTTPDSVTINAPGTYTVTVDDFALAGPVTLNAPGATLSLVNPTGTTFFDPTTVTISAGTLSIRASVANITVSASSLTNAGVVNFYADSLINYPNTVVNFRTGTGPVVNSGTIEAHEVPASTLSAFYTVAGSSPQNTFTNTGTIRTVGKSLLYLSNYNTFNQNAGMLDGEIVFAGSTFNYNGGSCSPTVPVGLTSATLNIAPAATAGNFSLGTNSSITGDIPAGNTVRTSSIALVRWNANGSSVTNAGRLVVSDPPHGQWSSTVAPSLQLPTPSTTLLNTGSIEINNPALPVASFSGSISNQGAFTVNPANTTATTTITGSFTNAGAVSLAANTALATGYSFTHNGGSLTVSPSASLSLTNAHFYYNGGTASGPVSLNNSTLHFAPGLPAASATFTATGSTPFAGDIPAGVTVIHSIPTSLPLLSLSSFSNAGSFRIVVPSTSVARPVYRLDNFAGSLTNTGSLGGTVNGVDRGLYAEIDGTLTNTGAIRAYQFTLSEGVFNQNAGTLYVDGYCVASQSVVNYNGGTLSGNPVDLVDSTLNLAPGTNPASFQFSSGTNTLHGSNAPGSILALGCRPGVTGVTVSVTADPFTNAGTLSLNGTFGSCNSTLTLPNNGTLTNTGTLSVTKNSGGTRTLNANVTNTGTFSVGTGATLTLNGSLSTSTPLDLKGTLDLCTGPLLWLYTTPSPIDTLRSHLATSHLISSSSDATHRLGYLDTGSSLTALLTLAGDANCDGTLDADDYALLDRAYAKSLANAHWADGDFNYDGAVTSADYLQIDTTYLQQQGGAPSPDFLSMRESQFGAEYVSQLLTSVPEPSSLLTACGLAVLPLSRRRRCP